MQINIIVNWSKFRSHKDIQIFIDFANFYPKFIRNFFKIAILLTFMLEKDVKNKFTKFFAFAIKIQGAFNLLKKRFIDVSMFKHFNFEKQFKLKTNAFNHNFFDILTKLITKTKEWHSMIFWFRKIKSSKRNYVIEKQKMLIIIENCKQFRQYIENAFESIRIVIDHCNFKTFLRIKF